MDQISTDVAIVGAGIAGAGLAAELAGDFSVVLIERESRPGYHSTGRSAAIFIQNYGNSVIRSLSRASRPRFEAADPTLFPSPLLKRRGMLTIADADSLAALESHLKQSAGLQQISVDQACSLMPLIRRDRLVAAAFEPDALDIDVAALHQGWLKKAKAGGARLVTDAELFNARRVGGRWVIETRAGTIDAAIVVDAAGAWADSVAEACGVAPLTIRPLRRSIAVLPAPAGHDVSRWPLVDDAAERWYMKPESGRLLVSPADEDPVEPHDAFVDDMVLAEGLDRFERAIDLPVTRVETRWAGLRSFPPDRTPVAGFDSTAEGFFWLAGQGGYGIQTSPALSRLAGQLIRRASIPDDLAAVVPALSPDRFRN
ncbi:FAD-binding oxidoreductase [Mesorhizobium sp. BAC0120]|uniref:NAD(P)/FAD-dependent oxidoreductase n=1 Tax=Mesorhizobium sp. BAC0120 TaxID=3090670 RepID=UPI00298C8F9A|nr:FAD-binding oxidoreductase [Mesorhizobium sp. BAC0120]MDW6024136.1 FAD-binding oxidoreductase [Mesorhizobium sp. BAC0120]